MSIPHSRRARKGAAKKNTRGAHASRNAGFPLIYWARRISARSPTHEYMPSASFDDKKNSDFRGRVSRRTGRAWDGRIGWERVGVPRRGRRGYFARRAVVEPTSGPSGCGWENGRGQVGAGGRMVGADVPGGPPPARGAAGRPTTEPRAGVGCRRARGTRAPTNVGVLMCQGQPTWEARADATRRGRHGYFARGDVGGRLWIWPWVGCWPTAAQIWPRQARPSRVAEGVGDARFHVGTVPPGRYTARRRAKYPRRPRRGTLWGDSRRGTSERGRVATCCDRTSQKKTTVPVHTSLQRTRNHLPTGQPRRFGGVLGQHVPRLPSSKPRLQSPVEGSLLSQPCVSSENDPYRMVCQSTFSASTHSSE